MDVKTTKLQLVGKQYSQHIKIWNDVNILFSTDCCLQREKRTLNVEKSGRTILIKWYTNNGLNWDTNSLMRHNENTLPLT